MKKDIKQSIGNATLNAEGLGNFFKYGKLKRAALTAVAFQLSDKEIEDLAKIFNQLDQDGDGQLSYNELIQGRDLLTSRSRTAWSQLQSSHGCLQERARCKGEDQI